MFATRATEGGMHRETLTAAGEALAAAGVGSPWREARRLVELAAQEPWSAVHASGHLPRWARGRLRRLVAARASGVPTVLLSGRTGFLDFELRVAPGVFVPRPETEELAERAAEVLRALSGPPRVLDLGCGSGALAVAVARARPDARVVAVDLSPRARRCARDNARALGVADRVEVRRSDWYSAVTGKFHLIVSNPPYVPRNELDGLPPEIRCYEPRLALDGGARGLQAVYRILAQAPAHLLPGGWIMLEIDHRQGRDVQQFAHHQGYLIETSVERDLAGKERFFVGRCR
ncbi:MAG: peptide chain release factor N(5)-glutamine methyltransferase [Candidatus Bipolaricaulaceae bacterium]